MLNLVFESVKADVVHISICKGTSNSLAYPASQHACLFINRLTCIGQGVKLRNKAGKEEYTLCDPVIHCESQLARFCNTNLGAAGYEAFFRTHKCNDICRQLGLSSEAGSKHRGHAKSSKKNAISVSLRRDQLK